MIISACRICIWEAFKILIWLHLSSFCRWEKFSRPISVKRIEISFSEAVEFRYKLSYNFNIQPKNTYDGKWKSLSPYWTVFVTFIDRNIGSNKPIWKAMIKMYCKIWCCKKWWWDVKIQTIWNSCGLSTNRLHLNPPQNCNYKPHQAFQIKWRAGIEIFTSHCHHSFW